jgi:hypothetical protein
MSSLFLLMTAILPSLLRRAQSPAAKRCARHEPTTYGEFTRRLLALNFADAAATIRPLTATDGLRLLRADCVEEVGF